MYRQVVNVLCPSASIHTFVFDWDMTRVHDGMPLRYYPTTFIIPPSNTKKFLLQTAINQATTVGYKFSHRNHQCQVLLLVGEGHKISKTNKMNLLVCIAFQVFIYLTEN